jgi:hypothetical protein
MDIIRTNGELFVNISLIEQVRDKARESSKYNAAFVNTDIAIADALDKLLESIHSRPE